MSYHITATYTLVVCDLCGIRGPAGHRDWKRMCDDAHDVPIHLCPLCRPIARWCAIHERYHRPDDYHRCVCVDCGGLFTTNVRSQVAYCPSCMRAHANPGSLNRPGLGHQMAQRGLVSRLREIMWHR